MLVNHMLNCRRNCKQTAIKVPKEYSDVHATLRETQRSISGWTQTRVGNCTSAKVQRVQFKVRTRERLQRYRHP